MQPAIEFLFDFASPNVYLACRALPPILERTGARLELIPCLLGGIFKATNNKSPIVAFAPVKGKVEYEMLEIRRFIARHGIDKFRMNPHFPVNSLMLMRGLVEGMWEEGLKLDDPEVLRQAMAAAGLDGASLMELAHTEAVKQKLADNTAAAVERGVFGLPAFFVGKEMFWGKERLGQVEEAVSASVA
jgi:2-hydroxychromene-2-carboxylate isomerase